LENRGVGAQFSAASQTGSEAQPVTNSIHTVNEMHGIEHTPPSRANVKTARIYTSTKTHLFMVDA
jgi:hypothetical protein